MFERDTDVLDNFRIISNENVKIKFIIDGHTYDTIDMAAHYHQFALKIISTKPTMNANIWICYKGYLFKEELQKELTLKDTDTYYRGMVVHRLV